jgi:GTP cyclohydrolase II
MDRIAANGSGVIVYLQNHEGRGIGYVDKLRAYRLQDVEGLDTVEANHRLGHEPDERDYLACAEILRDLGIRKVQLLTNNPQKVDDLMRSGLEVQRVPIQIDPDPGTERYLRTKRDRLGHML